MTNKSSSSKKMWLAFEACKCRESCTVCVCASGEKKRGIYLLDIWLYIRVFLYYILYNFYKRVFEFMCMTKKGVMVFLFFFNKKKKQKTALFSFYQHSAAVPYCMIKENSTCNSIYPETFCERYWYTLYSKQNKHLIALECFFFLCQPWPYRNTTHVHCNCMKEELWCQLFLVRQMFSSWDICGGTQLKHFFYIHFINKQDCVPASRNAGKTSCVRRHSTCSDAVKSTVRAVPLRLFHLFHNTTSYCEAALIQFGRKYSSVLQENYFWLKFATRCGQM